MIKRRKRIRKILWAFVMAAMLFATSFPAGASGGEAVTADGNGRLSVRDAGAGQIVGHATWSVELFTIGCGYLISPTEVPIYAGETSAEALIRLLHDNGYVGYYDGTPRDAFYIAYIADGTSTRNRFNNYVKSGTPANPRLLNLSPSIPPLLVPYLNETMTFFDPGDYEKSWTGYMGEFVITNGSGWMFSVNNVFPNVGFADTYLSDGDVVRVQLTLAYGADIGGLGTMGGNVPNVDRQPESGFYPTANKDALTKVMSRAGSSGLMAKNSVKQAYDAAAAVMETLNASQSSVDGAVARLSDALAHPDGTAAPSSGRGNGSGQNSGTGGSSQGNTGNSGSQGSGNSHSTGGGQSSSGQGSGNSHSTGSSQSSTSGSGQSSTGSNNSYSTGGSQGSISSSQSNSQAGGTGGSGNSNSQGSAGSTGNSGGQSKTASRSGSTGSSGTGAGGANSSAAPAKTPTPSAKPGVTPTPSPGPSGRPAATSTPSPKPGKKASESDEKGGDDASPSDAPSDSGQEKNSHPVVFWSLVILAVAAAGAGTALYVIRKRKEA